MTNPLLAAPARIVMPLLWALLTLPSLGLLYLHQVKEHRQMVVLEEHARLLERMALEQTRIENRLASGDPFQLRRLVAALALHQGITYAWLIDREGRILASLARPELGQPIEQVIAHTPPAIRTTLPALVHSSSKAIRIQQTGDWLVGDLLVRGDYRLIVALDLSYPIAERQALNRRAHAISLVILLGFSLLLALTLHLLWFRRAARLADAVAQLGAGDLAARAGLSGQDELARLGSALDTMAARLEAQHTHLKRLDELIRHSPIIAIVWRNAPGWPVEYVSDNVRQWGYAPQALLDGTLQYIDLIHPDDRARIEADVAHHLAFGPDEYIQEYRLRRADHSYLWIEDRTWLARDATGQVTTIQGVLMDIEERKRAEAAIFTHSEALKARNAELERFARLSVDRELVMIALKREVNALCARLGEAPRYDLARIDTEPVEPRR